MAAVKSKHTAVELAVRRALFSGGFRYRLYRTDLPGTPDIVMPKHRVVVFVNGCFWHYHECGRSSIPKTRSKWWKAKLLATRNRDIEIITRLQSSGWRIFIVWECWIRKIGVSNPKLHKELVHALSESPAALSELPERADLSDMKEESG